MQICFGEWAPIYLLIGALYVGVKLWGGWEYHVSRSLYTRAHHAWFELWFWPIDMVKFFILRD